MRWLRALFFILLLTISIVVIAVAALILFVDPNKLKPIIISEIKNNTGYALTIEDQLSWSFYPRFSVKIDHMTLASSEKTAPFLNLYNVKIGVPFSQFWAQGLHSFPKLSQLNLLGDITVSKLLWTNLHVENAHIDMQLRKVTSPTGGISNRITLFPRANLYGGTLRGVLHASLDSIPTWDWDLNFDNVQLDDLLNDLQGSNRQLRIAGLAHLQLKANSQGKTKEEFLQHLKGSSEFGLTHGKLFGIDLNYLVTTADALINKEPVSPPENLQQTVFDRLTGTATISNGVVNSKDLLLVSSAFTAKAQGNINLLTQMIVLQMQISSQQNIKTGWQVPVLISGHVNAPDIRLDMHETQKAIIKNEWEKIKNKVEDEITKHISDKPFFKNLLNH